MTEKNDIDDLIFEYVNTVETRAITRSNENFGELSWGFVAGYISGDITMLLMDLKLNKKQQKILLDHLNFNNKKNEENA